MSNKESNKGALVSGTLSAKIEMYYKRKLGAEVEFLEERGISATTQQAVLDDLWQKLTYTDQEITATLEQINELYTHIPQEDVVEFAREHGDGVFLTLIQEYLRMARIADMSHSLQQMEVKIDGILIMPPLSEEEALSEAEKLNPAPAQDIRLEALRQELTYEGEDERAQHLERTAAETRYANFLAQSIVLSGATDEELLLVVPQDLPPISQDQIKRLLVRTRKDIAADKSLLPQECRPAESKTKDENKPIAERKGAVIVRLHQNITDALSGPLIMARQSKAESYPDGIELTDTMPVPKIPGIYSLSYAIEKENEEQAEAARKEGREPVRLTATRVYQCLHGLEVLANEYGEPVTSKTGVSYFEYLTSYRKLAEVCYNNPSPNAEEIKQTAAALEVLRNNYTMIREDRVKNVRVEGPDGKKTTKRVVKQYAALVQLIMMPTITFKNNLDGSLNKDITAATLDIMIHSVLRTGRRQSNPVIINGRPEFLLTPQRQYIPYSIFQESLRYFQSKDGSGQRFFNMILAKAHKMEDEMLVQIFDYKGKIEQAIRKAEKKLQRSWSKLPADEQPDQQQTVEELEQAANEAEKKARRSISKNKARDRETLRLWFEQAVELDLIEPNPQRKPSKSMNGSYVWEWQRKPTKRNDMITQ